MAYYDRTDAGKIALERLEILVGEWEVEADLPGASGPARTKFEWILDGAFLLQSAEIPHPEAPDSHSIFTADPESGAYSMHYFDSRGVVRIYEMDLDDERWTMTRTEPDFSPLPFAQRYSGTFEDDGRAIVGQWEKADDGTNWEVDFGLNYRKAD